MDIYASMCGFIHMSAGAYKIQKSESDYPHAGIIGGCELPNMSTGNWILVFLQNSLFF